MSKHDMTGRQWNCHRCGHTWRGRLPTPPVRCPLCQSHNWHSTQPEEAASIGDSASRSGAGREDTA